MTYQKLIKFSIIGSALGLFMSLSWALVDTVIHTTGDHEFCSGCHSHKPIGTSYREDLHGGNNTTGWRASCSDCHIPQDNALHYLWVKGVHGIVDPTMEILKDPLDIDWHGNRLNRERYVYDSGCLQCHKYLSTTSEANRKSFLPHRKYFNEEEEGLHCVGCHENVGHSNLGIHLEKHGWEKNNDD
ncbi:cytochrome c3 family protein [Teredinibacter purpureus]|jgi:Nitrate/TMAO reductases, membrane-bound tetraheme cytochrome c subunit|uniref:cytochrome c3 family protein n=1 Tax=Teredinibacter purpureus TaxID=2731756 RepID=UPI0005F887B2|nr:NapC/NirT family cytochrome c [Teredinibacter purpureus]